MYQLRLRPILLLLGSLACVGCSPNSLESIAIIPVAGSQTISAVGQTAQFKAIGTYKMGSAQATTQDITSSATWTSANTGVATINSSGIATGVSAGNAVITAGVGGIVASSDVTVTASASGGGAVGAIASIAISPTTQSVSAPTQTSQFLAIGTTSTGATVNLTNQVGWSSSSTQIATIGTSTGLALAVAQGSTTITALYANASNGTVLTNTATFTVTGGTSQQYTAVAITPNSQSLAAGGQTAQFIALGTSGITGLQQDVTKLAQLTWSSSSPSIASISASGLATGLSAGTTTITAQLASNGSVVSNTATLEVSLTPAPDSLVSVTIIPSSITVGNLQDTGQFLAIGTFSTVPFIRDLTNSHTLIWLSSVPNVFPVNTNTSGSPGATAGIVTAYGSGSAVIIAEATGSNGSIQTAIATFTCPVPTVPPVTGQCFQGSQAPALLATLTVYNQGLNTTNWLVTAPSATGTPNVLHCGGLLTGNSVCVATYPIGSTVTLTAPAQTLAPFGGWSSNCTATAPVTATGPNSCTVTLTTNDTVGAIFN